MPYCIDFWVADSKSKTRFSKFKMAVAIWPSLYLKKYANPLRLSIVLSHPRVDAVAMCVNVLFGRLRHRTAY